MSAIDPAQSLDRREPAELVQRLTLEQKVRLLTGADFWGLHPMDEVGLRRLVVSDGPVGVRGESLDEREPSANTPSPTAIAASWDVEVASAVGAVLGAEARRKGADVVLAPVINLQRTPYGGRHFEAFSEDPFLTGVLGSACIRGVQAQGVGACAKHFVANDSETERFTLDAIVDERTLREVYLAPFELAVRDAEVWTVMAAYNGVNGSTMTESPLLREVLQDEWGFDGVTMTDWFAGRSVEQSAKAALDLCMPGPAGPWVVGLVEAVRGGLVDEALIDDKVERLLRLAGRTGALDGYAEQRAAAVDVSAALRAAASAGMVLVRNEPVDGAPVLPLDVASGSTVAVIGRHSVAPRTLGGGSAQVAPPYVVSPLDGLAAVLGDRISHAPGVHVSDRVQVLPLSSVTAPDGAPGVELTYLGHDGSTVRVENRPGTSFLWIGHFGAGLATADVAEIVLRTTLLPREDGDLVLGVSALGHVRVGVDGADLVDQTLELVGGDVVEGFVRPPQGSGTVAVTAGVPLDVVVRYDVPASGGTFDAPPICLLQLVGEPVVSDDEELDRAAAAAAAADVAIVVVGTAEDESEGFDRTTLALPGRQDDLVRRVAAANPRTVVVVNSGAPVLLPWRHDVAAVLLTWFPGQEFGHALADVVTGAVEPGGRLPVTWPADEAGLPSATPVDGVLQYAEGLHVGHRAYDRDGVVPAYRFGHGLGYTGWALSSATAAAALDGGGTVTVSLANVGDRPGSEVVQVYASRPGSSVERPERWLAGFARAVAASGETATAVIPISARAFEHWAPGRGWALEPGEFVLHVGRSSGDLPLTTVVTPSGAVDTGTTAI